MMVVRCFDDGKPSNFILNYLNSTFYSLQPTLYMRRGYGIGRKTSSLRVAILLPTLATSHLIVPL